jgi:hypothetical protein
VIELCEKWFRRFFPKLGFFAGFSLYIILIAARSGEAAIGGAGRAQRLVLRVNESKKTGARSARVCTRGKNPIVQSKL